MGAATNERRLAAILAADVVGYSRMIGADETGTLARLRTLRREVVEPLVAENGGRVFKTTGDGLLVEFPSTVQALRCAIGLQERLRGDELQLRVGVHQGDVVVDGDDLLGDGVNVAARLEGLAEPGGICISGRVREDAAGKLSLDIEDLGTPELKNIAQPIRVFRVRLDPLERPVLPLPDKPSLAVLPFQNMSGDPEQEYFVDGLVEDITTALSRIGGLFVIARNSSFTYKGRAVDVRQVGRELGVRYVLEGSVRRAGGRARITCQLIEAASGRHVWADRFEGDLADIFELQDRITESVVGAIEPNLQRAEIARASAKPTDKLDAYDLYLRALPHLHVVTREGHARALELLLDAIRVDPDYAVAKALAGLIYILTESAHWAGPDDLAHGAALAREALALDRDDPYVLSMAAATLAYAGVDTDAALAAAQRALALNPNSAQVLVDAAWVHSFAGDAAVAIGLFERAIRLSPLDPMLGFAMHGLGWAYLQAGRDEDAHATFLLSIRERQGANNPLRGLAFACVRLGRLDEARSAVRRVLDMIPDFRMSNHPFPYRNPDIAQEYREAMRVAGLPE